MVVRLSDNEHLLEKSHYVFIKHSYLDTVYTVFYSWSMLKKLLKRDLWRKYWHGKQPFLTWKETYPFATDLQQPFERESAATNNNDNSLQIQGCAKM